MSGEGGQVWSTSSRGTGSAEDPEPAVASTRRRLDGEGSAARAHLKHSRLMALDLALGLSVVHLTRNSSRVSHRLIGRPGLARLVTA